VCTFLAYESEMVDGQASRIVCARSGEVTWSTREHSVRPGVTSRPDIMGLKYNIK